METATQSQQDAANEAREEMMDQVDIRRESHYIDIVEDALFIVAESAIYDVIILVLGGGPMASSEYTDESADAESTLSSHVSLKKASIREGEEEEHDQDAFLSLVEHAVDETFNEVMDNGGFYDDSPLGKVFTMYNKMKDGETSQDGSRLEDHLALDALVDEAVTDIIRKIMKRESITKNSPLSKLISTLAHYDKASTVSTPSTSDDVVVSHLVEDAVSDIIRKSLRKQSVGSDVYLEKVLLELQHSVDEGESRRYSSAEENLTALVEHAVTDVFKRVISGELAVEDSALSKRLAEMGDSEETTGSSRRSSADSRALNALVEKAVGDAFRNVLSSQQTQDDVKDTLLEVGSNLSNYSGVDSAMLEIVVDKVVDEVFKKVLKSEQNDTVSNDTGGKSEHLGSFSSVSSDYRALNELVEHAVNDMFKKIARQSTLVKDTTFSRAVAIMADEEEKESKSRRTSRQSRGSHGSEKRREREILNHLIETAISQTLIELKSDIDKDHGRTPSKGRRRSSMEKEAIGTLVEGSVSNALEKLINMEGFDEMFNDLSSCASFTRQETQETHEDLSSCGSLHQKLTHDSEIIDGLVVRALDDMFEKISKYEECAANEAVVTNDLKPPKKERKPRTLRSGLRRNSDIAAIDKALDIVSENTVEELLKKMIDEMPVEIPVDVPPPWDDPNAAYNCRTPLSKSSSTDDYDGNVQALELFSDLLTKTVIEKVGCKPQTNPGSRPRAFRWFKGDSQETDERKNSMDSEVCTSEVSQEYFVKRVGRMFDPRFNRGVFQLVLIKFA